MSEKKQADNNPKTNEQTKKPAPKWVDTGSSWVGVIVFLFTTGYLQKKLGGTIFDVNLLMYCIIGAAVIKIALDVPGKLIHGYVAMSIVKDKTGAELLRAINKAGAVGTIIKASVVVIAYMLAKYGFQEFFLKTMQAATQSQVQP